MDCHLFKRLFVVLCSRGGRAYHPKKLEFQKCLGLSFEGILKLIITVGCVLVSTAAGFFLLGGGRGVSRNGALRDIPKNGCGGD